VSVVLNITKLNFQTTKMFRLTYKEEEKLTEIYNKAIKLIKQGKTH